MSTPIGETTRLHADLLRVGCTFDGLAIYPPAAAVPEGGSLLVAPAGEQVRITDLPAEQESLAQGVIDTFVFGTAQVRLAFDIYQDLGGLTAQQLTRIWSDLTSGNPPKWGAYFGTNSGAIIVMEWSATNSGAAGDDLNDARKRTISLYVQDHPGYLVTPPFDPTINIPGLEPAP